MAEFFTTVGFFVETVKNAVNYRLQQNATEDARREAIHLALRLLGSVQFENRRNIERLRLIVEIGKENQKNIASEQRFNVKIADGQFDFSVSEAVLPELCRVAPSPLLLDRVSAILSAVRRCDFHQRVAGQAQALEAVAPFFKAVAFAQDALRKGVVASFNDVNRLGKAVGKEQFPAEWPAQEQLCFPDDIDPTAAIDHSLI